ncbi:MAG: hypothetical protein Q8P26_02870 [Candidatus Levybacteria bacterium]|nr:hypothetical protein [Candidatus Levybacteria bacterium]
MLYLISLFVEIGILFFLSGKISKTLSRFISINLLSFIFLPGVIVHELAHLLMAVVLFVPVGDMEFSPKVIGGTLKLGSVQIGKTDPIRRAMIGFAPFFAGLMLIVGIVYFFTANILFFQDKGIYLFAGSIVVMGYFLFVISNTMFSSKKDMEGAIEILLALLIIFVAAYAIGFRVPMDFVSKIPTEKIFQVVEKSTIFILAPIVIDLVLLSVIRIFSKRQ